jgi:D-alanine-D-alanine ligase
MTTIVNADRVVVLAGGLSHEREVSLRSGRRVSHALRSAGFEVTERDVDATMVTAFADDPPPCVVPLLHGEAGEDGALQEVLSLLRIPYVGSKPTPCRLAFDKPIAKAIVGGAGVATPAAVTLPAEMFREIGAVTVMDALVDRLDLPLVIKPAQGGSALGCTVVRDRAELPGAMVSCFAYSGTALVEQFIEGVEVAVPVVDLGSGPEALPAVEIRPDGGVYDFSARYTAGATEFVVPAALPAAVAADCAQVALTAQRALGLGDLSRSDLIVDAKGQVWFLEVNVAPGMTDTSLVPLSVEAAGHDLGKMCGRLVELAISRDRSYENRLRPRNSASG